MDAVGPHTTVDPRAVAIVIPRYTAELSASEALSLRHLTYFLPGYEKIYISPTSLAFDAGDFGIKRFDDGYFTGADAYSKLLLSRHFYEAFADFEYILIYQLDALVFSDQLLKWCATNLDYIGAPWLKDRNVPEQGFSRCGNGGFSLRRVQSFLKVLRSQSLIERLKLAVSAFAKPLADVTDGSRSLRVYHRLLVFRAIMMGGIHYAVRYKPNEDVFWSDRAVFFSPEFKVAPVEIAIKFSFEQAPRYCFEQNNRTIPFGCHAWEKYDRNFWRPYLRL